MKLPEGVRVITPSAFADELTKSIFTVLVARTIPLASVNWNWKVYAPWSITVAEVRGRIVT